MAKRTQIRTTRTGGGKAAITAAATGGTNGAAAVPRSAPASLSETTAALTPSAEPTTSPRIAKAKPARAKPAMAESAKPKPPTKHAQLVAMLAGQLGASLSQLVALTGWQPHSVRAALSGLRKQGYRIEASKEGSTALLYRITAGPGEATAGPIGAAMEATTASAETNAPGEPQVPSEPQTPREPQGSGEAE